MKGFEQAAALDPTNANYRLAAGVARSHAVTALIQEAAKDRLLGNEAAARAALERARALDPTNIEVSQHLDELADDVARSQPQADLRSKRQAPWLDPYSWSPLRACTAFICTPIGNRSLRRFSKPTA